MQTIPAKPKGALQKQYLLGYKLQVILSESGVSQNRMLRIANAHDITLYKESYLQMMGCTLLDYRPFYQ